MRFAILGSGRGSNAEALLSAWRQGGLGRAVPVGIVCDQAGARILSLGEEFGLPALHIGGEPFRTKLEGLAEERYLEQLAAWEVDLVVLAGFMRVVKQGFLTAFGGRIINLHPSLLPAFPGRDAIAQALAYGVRVTGCTVHRVTAEVDVGPILDQEAVRVEPGDTAETLARRIHEAEHRLLPRVVRELAENWTGRA